MPKGNNTFEIFFLKLDIKTKMIEAKCHEEKLKLQQKHDADVQKVGSLLFILSLTLNTQNILGLVTIPPIVH